MTRRTSCFREVSGGERFFDILRNVEQDPVRFAAVLELMYLCLSLGFEGKTEKLPATQVLALSTMCGHGMISSNLAKKMIDWVKEGRRTPEQAVTYLQRFCSCGVFNPSRAKRILVDARNKTK